MSWQPGISNPFRGIIVWPEPDPVDITVTLYKVMYNNTVTFVPLSIMLLHCRNYMYSKLDASPESPTQNKSLLNRMCVSDEKASLNN